MEGVVENNSFEIQIASDLHIEYKNNKVPNAFDYITPKAKNLILAGDIGTFYKYDQLFGFIKQLEPYFMNIIYVLGNHEYYKPVIGLNEEDVTPLTMGEIRNLAKKMQTDIPNLWILDNATVRIGNYCIIGCTLWSDIKIGLPRHIVKIHGMTTKIYANKFSDGVKFIQEEIRKCKEKGRKAIVVTHYMPTYSILSKERTFHKYASLYASNLDHLISNPVDTWICGHIHRNFDIIINGTRLVSNQRGKPRDNIEDYSKQFTLSF